LIPPLGLLRGAWRVFWRLYVKRVGREKTKTTGYNKRSDKGTRGERPASKSTDLAEEIELEVRY
jgi:hypothetical protein